MRIKKFIYALPEEDFYNLVYEKSLPVEVIKREKGQVIFALYREIEDLKPLEVQEIKEDWERWRERFKPIEVNDFVILPPWKRAVYIKPGMAFGTGLHPTTRLCIKALKKHLNEGMSVLDVGTGSGILAIISKMLGASYVLGIDVSDDAIRECEENAKLNGVEINCFKAEPRDIKENFDLVVANLEIKIFRGVLKDIKPKFRKVGIFSGLYREEDLKEFEKLLGMGFYEVLEEENWYCVVVKK
ncbi:50S ribosomal protein L11 methyltransferase [Aquifex pyrophilus]